MPIEFLDDDNIIPLMTISWTYMRMSASTRHPADKNRAIILNFVAFGLKNSTTEFVKPCMWSQ